MSENTTTKTSPETGKSGGDFEKTVDHPPHYKGHPSGYECIEVVEHMPCNLANAVKYMWRHGKKGDPGEDLRKALWYLAREEDRWDHMGLWGRMVRTLFRYLLNPPWKNSWSMGEVDLEHVLDCTENTNVRNALREVFKFYPGAGLRDVSLFKSGGADRYLLLRARHYLIKQLGSHPVESDENH